ncbi:MAG TPA: heavy metal response regulator transcription factor [Thermodesulfobacteriota bacterium]|nr:heavy metal response regulator transcription factor [Thermodesulfobacteriota bacterium]HOC39697.1 heavy metal response regulator transcription factor [Thermodesulfobacteriota bacterium]
MRILLVEDDTSVARFVAKGLIESSFSVDVAYNGEDGLHLASEEHYDLIILDIMLPAMNGDEILRQLRRQKITTPIIFLSAKDSIRDIVEGLDLGADDYLVKPFSFHELLARVRALLRRGRTVSSAVLQVADLSLNQLTREVRRGNVMIELTPKEFALLEYLMSNAGEVLTRTMISEHVWNYDFDSMTNIIDVHINHLRTKVDKSFEPKLIHTVKGVGYVLKRKD